jgi:hypothetical protein
MGFFSMDQAALSPLVTVEAPPRRNRPARAAAIQTVIADRRRIANTSGFAVLGAP